jgi:hypothetical protein
VVASALSLGALVGVLLSAGFVWFEIGRYATPQVPETLFDERREIFAYTAGLFVGIPLAVAFVFYDTSLANGALPGAVLFLAGLVGGTEAAQWALLRSRYWGRDESGPFYALGLRAGIGGILALTVVTQYLGGPTVTAVAAALAVVVAVAILGLEIVGALLSIPPRPGGRRSRGGALAGAMFGTLGFVLVGVGPLGGEIAAFVAALLVAGISAALYRNLRPSLAVIPAPSRGAPPPPTGAASFGRTRPPGP